MAGEESLSEERRGETLKQVWEGEQRTGQTLQEAVGGGVRGGLVYKTVFLIGEITGK